MAADFTSRLSNSLIAGPIRVDTRTVMLEHGGRMAGIIIWPRDRMGGPDGKQPSARASHARASPRATPSKFCRSIENMMSRLVMADDDGRGAMGAPVISSSVNATGSPPVVRIDDEPLAGNGKGVGRLVRRTRGSGIGHVLNSNNL